MLGRPVVRRLLAEGETVRVMARDLERAKTLLPSRAEIVEGDLRDEDSVRAAMAGARAVHVNLENAMASRRPEWDPDADGAMTVLKVAEAMGESGPARLSRISALGVDHPDVQGWWPARAKRETDEAWLDSPVETTIFRPTWFMESLPLFVRRGFLMITRIQDVPLHWVAGDDLSRMINAAFDMPSAANRVYLVQGPERLTMREAARRFAAARPERIRVVSIPAWTMRLAGLAVPQVGYLMELMDATVEHFAPIDAKREENDLPAPIMDVETYAMAIDETGDWPKK